MWFAGFNVLSFELEQYQRTTYIVHLLLKARLTVRSIEHFASRLLILLQCTLSW